MKNRYRCVDERRGIITGYRSTPEDAAKHCKDTGATRYDDRVTGARHRV